MRHGVITLLIFLQAYSSFAQYKWSYVGPSTHPEQVKGMVKAVWSDPDHPEIVLAGSSCGGLFLSQDATSAVPHWRCINDDLQRMNFGISDVVVVPGTEHSKIFISTCSRSGVVDPYGAGIWMTEDGGKVWQHVGPGNERDLNFPMDGLVMNSENQNEMIAYAPRSLYITRDAWKTFEEVKGGFDANDKDLSITDAQFAPFEAGKFYIGTRTNNKYTAQVLMYESYGNRVKDITPADIRSERAEIAVLHQPRFKGKFYVACGWVECYVKFFNGKEYSLPLNAQPITQTFAGAYWNLEFAVSERDTSVMYLSMTETSRSTNSSRSGRAFRSCARTSVPTSVTGTAPS